MPKVAVIGDAILDRYLECEVTRISPEAPVPVYRALGETEKPGGAAHVFENVKGFFSDADFIHGGWSQIVTRVVSGKHYLSRIDSKGVSYTPEVDYDQYDAFIVSDYDKGFVTRTLVHRLQKTGKPIYLAGKRRCFNGLELFVLNEAEAYKVNSRMGIHNTPNHYVVTLGDKGARYQDGTVFPVIARDPVDVTGAGDVFFGHLACNLINGRDMPHAITHANDAAALSVTQFGTTVVSPGLQVQTPLIDMNRIQNAV